MTTFASIESSILLMANASGKEQVLLALDNEDPRMGPPGRVQELQSEQASLIRLRAAVLPPTGLSPETSGGGEISEGGTSDDLPEVVAREYLGKQRGKILRKHFEEKAGSLERSPGFYGTLQELVVLAAAKTKSPPALSGWEFRTRHKTAKIKARTACLRANRFLTHFPLNLAPSQSIPSAGPHQALPEASRQALHQIKISLRARA